MKKFAFAGEPADDDLDATYFTGDDEEDGTAQAVADDNATEAIGDSEDILDRDPFEKTEDELEGQYFWSLNGTSFIRHHRDPRTRLFSRDLV